MRVIVYFKEGLARRYGFPKFQRTLTGEVVSEDSKVISIVPMRCTKNRIRNIQKEDTVEIERF